MSNIWLPYVPHHVVQDIVEHPQETPIERESRVKAVTLFADVSGFTAMSEALGHSGRRGTEELTDILNSYFEPMIALVERYGGIVGKFGGDAMTVMFPYTPETQREVVRRVLHVGLQMQKDMVNYSAIQTSAGVYALAMKVGIGMGDVYLTNVGDDEVRIEFIMAGFAIDECSDAEHHAEKGDVIITNTALSFVPEAVIAEDRDGFSKVTAFDADVSTAPLSPFDDLPEHVENYLQHYIHPSISDRLKIARSEFVDEHRRITLLFINFSGFDYDNDPDIHNKLQAYAENVVDTVDRYGGYLNKIDMGDKGSKYIVIFGAPISYEDDAERALRCALELSKIPDVPAKIGVNTGFVFAGHVGAQNRREYTVMGDVVNLSARLMQACTPGEVLVSGLTHDIAPGHFNWQTLEPIMVKGKSEPIEVYLLEGVKSNQSAILRAPEYQLPMVGRDDVLETITAQLDRTAGGQGQIIGVKAEAGMGKSRLSAEVIRLAFERDMFGYGGACQSFNTNLGYVVWQDVWRGFFALDVDAPPAVQIHDIEQQLQAIDPIYLERLPLLAPLINLPIAENDLTRELEITERQDLLFSLLLDLLKYRLETRNQPLLIVLEDCHWIDPLSRDLLTYLARNIVSLPICLLILYRPLSAGDRLVPDLPYFNEYELADFSDEHVYELVNLKLQQLFDTVVELPENLLSRIVQLANGNPFYVDELINLIHDQGIDIHDTNALQRIDLPDNLYNLILSRIDGLAEDEKTVLKVASIIGRIFRALWIPGVYPEVGNDMQVLRRLNRLEALELTPLDKPEPEIEYLFKHVLTQEVAYDSLSFSLRQDLHARVGSYIEKHYENRLEEFYYLLAFHYGNSLDVEKQRIYLRLAGDMARTEFMNQAAIDFYQRLLQLPDNPEQLRGDVLFALGQVQQHTGDWDAAIISYRESLQIAENANDLERIAPRRSSLGDVMSYTQDFETAVALLEQAEADYLTLNDDNGLNETLKHLSYVYTRRGDYETVGTYAQRQFELATRTGNNYALSDAAQNLGIVGLFTGKLETALSHFQQAADAAERVNYRKGVIYSLGNLTGAFLHLGDYKAALESLNQSLASAQEIGYSRAIAAITSNRGYVYMQAGMWDEALICYEDSLQALIELGDESTMLNIVGAIASILRELGDYDNALSVSERAVSMARLFDAESFLSENLLSMGQTLSAMNRHDEAVSTFAEAITTGESSDEPEFAFKAGLGQIESRVNAGQLSADDALEQLRNQLNTLDEEQFSERADILYTSWRISPQDDVAQQAIERYRELHNAVPTAEYYTRYQELGGDMDAINPLPDLPAVVRSVNHEDWQTLLARYDGTSAQ